MTQEQKRIKIAEACGYTDIAWLKLHAGNEGYLGTKCDGDRHRLPDYFNDLNAMHEAEKSLIGPGLGKWCEYVRHLKELCDEALHSEIHATAEQRAEAFGLTLGLW